MIFYIGTILLVSIFVGNKHKASMPFRKPIIIIFFNILGVKIHQSGTVPNDTVLYIGNHTSYLDPFVVVYHTIAHPVAKMEVSRWPLIGKTVALSGVIFVKRGNATSLRATRGEIAQALLDGKSVLVYPEGTTSDGSSTLPFRGGVFDIAHQHEIPVVPVTVAYKNPGAAYIGQDTFLPHFIHFFSSWRNEVYIHFDQPMKSESGKELLKETRRVIDHQLALYHMRTLPK
jgi:1-acyl-sn-glycerol-3-phosphate acyltransferase